MTGREVLYEFTQIGNYIKVTAIDPLTGLEVSIVGDVKAGQVRLKQTALRKLEYVLAKQGSAQR